MVALSHVRMKLFGILAAAALALCVLPATAFAAQVDIYVDNDTAETSALIASVDTAGASTFTTSVDAADTADPVNFKGQYLKGGVWNVVQGDNCITLDSLLKAYAPRQWKLATYVTFDTVDYPQGYDKYNNGVFTKAELTATGYFYGETLYNSALPLPGTATDMGPAVLTLKWGKEAQTAGTNAGATQVTTTDHDYPRLISGFTSSSPTAVGGNRFPAQITAIHLHR